MWGAFGRGLGEPPEQARRRAPYVGRSDLVVYVPPSPPLDQSAAALSDLRAALTGRPWAIWEKIRIRLQRLHARRLTGKRGLMRGWVQLFAHWRGVSRGVRLRRASLATTRYAWGMWRVLVRDRMLRLLEAELGLP